MLEFFDFVSQILIPLFGATAVFLSQCRTREKRCWAPVLGIISQPAWFFTTWFNAQWGIFTVSFVYAYAWVLGLYNHWFKGEG